MNNTETLFGIVIGGDAFNSLTRDEQLNNAIQILLILNKIQNYRLLNSPSNVLTKPAEIPDDLDWTWHQLIREVGAVINTSLSISGLTTAPYEGVAMASGPAQSILPVENEYNPGNQYDIGSRVFLGVRNYISIKTVVDPNDNISPDATDNTQWAELARHVYEAAFVVPAESTFRADLGGILTATSETRVDIDGNSVDVGGITTTNIKFGSIPAGTTPRNVTLTAELDSNGDSTGYYVINFQDPSTSIGLPTIESNDIVMGGMTGGDFIQTSGINLDTTTLPDPAMSSVTFPQLVTDGTGIRSLRFSSSAISLSLPDLPQFTIPVSDGTSNFEGSGILLNPLSLPLGDPDRVITREVRLQTSEAGQHEIVFSESVDFNLPTPLPGTADRVLKINNNNGEGDDYAVGPSLPDVTSSNVANSFVVITDVANNELGYMTAAQLGLSSGGGVTLPTISDRSVVIGDGLGNVRDSGLTIDLSNIIPASGSSILGITRNTATTGTIALSTFSGVPATTTAEDGRVLTVVSGVPMFQDPGHQLPDPASATQASTRFVATNSGETGYVLSELPRQVPDPSTGAAGSHIRVNTAQDDYEFVDAPRELPDPSTGADGQVPTLVSGVVEYRDIPAELPDSSAAMDGQVLTLQSGNLQYQDVPNELPEPSAGNSGMIPQVNSSGNDYDLRDPPREVPDTTSSENGHLLVISDAANNQVEFMDQRDLGVNIPYFYGYKDDGNNLEITKFSVQTGETTGQSFDRDNFEGHTIAMIDADFSSDGTRLQTDYGDFSLMGGSIGAFVAPRYNAWNDSTNYTTGNRVIHNSKLWDAKRDNTNVEPVEGDDWTQYGVRKGEVIFFNGSSFISTTDDNKNNIGDQSGSFGWMDFVIAAGGSTVADTFGSDPSGSLLTTMGTSGSLSLASLALPAQQRYLISDSTDDRGIKFDEVSTSGGGGGTFTRGDSVRFDRSIKPFGYMRYNYGYLASGHFFCFQTGQAVPSGCIASPASQTQSANKYRKLVSLSKSSRNVVLAKDDRFNAYLCENGNIVANGDDDSTYGSELFSAYNSQGGCDILDMRYISWFKSQDLDVFDVHISAVDSEIGSSNNYTDDSFPFFFLNNSGSASLDKRSGYALWFIVRDINGGTYDLYAMRRGWAHRLVDATVTDASNPVNDQVPMLILSNVGEKFYNTDDSVDALIWVEDKNTNSIRVYGRWFERNGTSPTSSISVSELSTTTLDRVYSHVSSTFFRVAPADNFPFMSTNSWGSSATAIAMNADGSQYSLASHSFVTGSSAVTVTENNSSANWSGTFSSFTTNLNSRSIRSVQTSPIAGYLLMAVNTTNGYLYTAGSPRFSNGSSNSGFAQNIAVTSSNASSLHPLGLAYIRGPDGVDKQGTIQGMSLDTFGGFFIDVSSGSAAPGGTITPMCSRFRFLIAWSSDGFAYMSDKHSLETRTTSFLSTRSSYAHYNQVYTKIPSFEADARSFGMTRVIGQEEGKTIVDVGFAGPGVPIIYYDDDTASIGNAGLKDGTHSVHSDISSDTDTRYPTGRINGRPAGAWTPGELGAFAFEPVIFK